MQVDGIWDGGEGIIAYGERTEWEGGDLPGGRGDISEASATAARNGVEMTIPVGALPGVGRCGTPTTLQWTFPFGRR